MDPGERLKVSLYVSVLNEAGTIEALLSSIRDQTRPPDEVIVVDGGSTDGTVEKVRQYLGLLPNLKVIEAAGSNIAQARNIGFSTATHDLVASIDAGCRADPRWLESLLEALGADVDIVCGTYVPEAHNEVEGAIGAALFPKWDEIPLDWRMPSHRSVLMRKSVWQAVGYFPDGLRRSEDTWFNLAAAAQGFRFRLAREAVVYWRTRKDFVDVLKNSFRYAHSDAFHRIYAAPNRRTFAAAAGKIVVVAPVFPILAAVGFCLTRRSEARQRSLVKFAWYTHKIGFVLGYVVGKFHRVFGGKATEGPKSAARPD